MNERSHSGSKRRRLLRPLLETSRKALLFSLSSRISSFVSEPKQPLVERFSISSRRRLPFPSSALLEVDTSNRPPSLLLFAFAGIPADVKNEPEGKIHVRD